MEEGVDGGGGAMLHTGFTTGNLPPRNVLVFNLRAHEIWIRSKTRMVRGNVVMLMILEVTKKGAGRT